MPYRLLRGVLLKLLYPALMLFGAFSKGGKEAFQTLVIRLNNGLVKKEIGKARPASTLLLLLPHCIQVDKCKIRLTHDVRNCQGCGECEIKDLISMADHGKFELFVATGGNLARRIVGEVGPDAVVAVACENDLSSGIADTFPMPVLGVTNERPFGPCINTRVDMKKVEQAIRALTGTSP